MKVLREKRKRAGIYDFCLQALNNTQKGGPIKSFIDLRLLLLNACQ